MQVNYLLSLMGEGSIAQPFNSECVEKRHFKKLLCVTIY